MFHDWDDMAKDKFNPWAALSQREKAKVEALAMEHLGIETLEVRNWDRLDFYDIGVGSLRQALATAYLLGAGQSEQSKGSTRGGEGS